MSAAISVSGKAVPSSPYSSIPMTCLGRGALRGASRSCSGNSILDFSVFRAGVFVNSVGDLTGLYHPQNPGDDLLRFLAHECVWEISVPIWRRSFLEELGASTKRSLSMQDLEMHVRALSARGKYVCFPGVDHDIRGTMT